MRRDVVGEANGRGLNVRSSGPGSSALADAAGLGLLALAEVVTRTDDGLAIVDADREVVPGLVEL
jgi:hypothetical protein